MSRRCTAAGGFRGAARFDSPVLAASVALGAAAGFTLAAALALVAVARTGLAAQRAPAGGPFLSHLAATRASPIYTTYAAALERSRFLLDEGYHLRFDDPARPIAYTTADAGEWGTGFRLEGRWAYALRDMAREPVITVSYGDVVRYHYAPFPTVRVEATFLVYGSRLAVEELALTNAGADTAVLTVVSTFRVPGMVPAGHLGPGLGEASFAHREPADPWTTEHGVPHVTDVQDRLLFSSPASWLGGFADATMLDRGEFPESVDEDAPVTRTPVVAVVDSTAPAPGMPGGLPPTRPWVPAVAAAKRFRIPPGGTVRWRVARAVAPADSDLAPLLADARRLLKAPLEWFIRADERLYRRLPPPPSADPDRRLLYYGAFTLLRQVMLPPEGGAKHDYYVFSREPQWGWGHGGQVFHESLSMLAYALMDPRGAMDSQRLFAQRQHADGYIPYRVGPYLEETIPYHGQLTTSAPWYAWENWEIYRITRDRGFLRDMYPSSARFWHWLAAHRDTDGDGLYEWGGHAVLESVRDGDVAVWDQVGWPAEFEALDLTTLMAAEAAALDSMAAALGKAGEASAWGDTAAALRMRIERTFWDDSTGFYYNVARGTHAFAFKAPDDLKRREIIGFLPLWAGTPSPARAQRLIAALTDPRRFWRPDGIPSLAADDPYFDPRGYWNGPVWVQWNYLVERGLLRYGRRDLARQLVDRVADGMIDQLKTTHTFWEMYGPDGGWAGHHQPYIWAGLIARMMLDAGEASR